MTTRSDPSTPPPAGAYCPGGWGLAPATSLPGTPGGSCTRRDGTRDTACRCSPGCLSAATTARRARHARAARGIPGRVPTGGIERAVRAWLAAHPGTTATDIARLADVAPRTVRNLLDGTAGPTMNRATAARLVRAQGVAPAGPVQYVSGVGTRRKVEALLAAGWPMKTIAARAGLSTSTLPPSKVIPRCSGSTAAAIDRVFQQLRLTLGPDQRTRDRAERAGCLPWPVWGSRINNPDAIPDMDGLAPVRVAAWQSRVGAGVGSVVSDRRSA